MNNDVFVFLRSMDEGEIDVLKFMNADHTERCRIHLYVTCRLDLWFTYIDLCLLQDFLYPYINVFLSSSLVG